MMNIYAIRRDGYDYQELDLDINDFLDDFPEEVDYGQAHDFSLENIAMSEFWKPMRTGFSPIEDNENRLPDITTWIDATLVLSPKAYRYLSDTLKPYGEFLPVIVEDDTYYIFNCLTPVEAVANESSESKLVLDENSIQDKLIFKSPYQRCMDIYCTDKLKDAIESFELTGVKFDLNLASPFSS